MQDAVLQRGKAELYRVQNAVVDAINGWSGGWQKTASPRVILPQNKEGDVVAQENTIQATITQVWWDVDLGDEVTPTVRIILPDETEVVLRDQIANGWMVESMTLGAGVDAAKSQCSDDADTAFHARYGADAEFDFDTLRDVRRVLMQKGSEYFQKGYAQPIALRNVKPPARSLRQK